MVGGGLPLAAAACSRLHRIQLASMHFNLHALHTHPASRLPPSPCPQEHALIEQSVNSARVSLKFKAADALEEYLLRTFLRFMMHR